MSQEREIKPMRFPAEIYGRIRAKVEKEQTTNREVLRNAIAENIHEVASLLEQAGFARAQGNRKLVRCSVALESLAEIRRVASETELDETTLILLCLRRYFGLLAKDKKTKKLDKRRTLPKD